MKLRIHELCDLHKCKGIKTKLNCTNSRQSLFIVYFALLSMLVKKNRHMQGRYYGTYVGYL